MNRQNSKKSKKSKTFWRKSVKIELKRTEEAFVSPWNPWIIPIEQWGIPGTYDKPIGSVQVLKPQPVLKSKRRLQEASKKSKKKLTALKRGTRKQRKEEGVEVEPDYDNPRPDCSGLATAASVQPEEEEVVEVDPDYDDPRPGCSELERATSVPEEEEDEEQAGEIEANEMWSVDRKGWLVDGFDVLRHPEIVDDFLKAMRAAAASSDDSD